MTAAIDKHLAADWQARNVIPAPEADDAEFCRRVYLDLVGRIPRIAEVRALRPRLIRLFIQEYFQLLPERGRYHFDTLDRSVDTILKTGAKPLMCICFKPRVLFPVIDHDSVAPNDDGESEICVPFRGWGLCRGLGLGGR